MPDPGAAAALASSRPEGAGRQDGLTVLIRARNQRPFLPRALRTALDALERLDGANLPAEVLVVDDASLDGSQRLLRGVQALYDEPRLETLFLEQKAGPEALLGLGLRASSYRHACLMDADDEILPSNLPLFLRAATETGAAMVFGNVIEKKDGRVAGVRSNMPPVPGFFKTRRLDTFSILDVEKVSNLEEAAPPDPEGTEGWNLALRLLAADEPVVFVPAVLGFHHEYSALSARRRRGTDEDPAPRARGRSDTPIGRVYHPEAGFLDE